MIDNPYAAPTEPDSSTSIATSVPLSTYGYALVMFAVGACGGGLAATVLMLPLLIADTGRGLLLIAGPIMAILGGLVSASRMWRRLVRLHHAKIAWRLEQIDRLGESY